MNPSIRPLDSDLKTIRPRKEAHVPKIVLMPPQTDRSRKYHRTLSDRLPDYDIVLAETDEDALREIVDADAAYGGVPPEALAVAKQLRWIQSAQAGPSAGYYYPELIAHQAVVTNPRGVFNDHIAQHILMYVLALARGLPAYIDAQRAGQWDTDARTTPYLELSEAVALIVGVGGIGHETARLLNAFGTRVLGIDARWEQDTPDVERHEPSELDVVLPMADFVIVATPHTPETEGMWNSARFALMKPTACFINIGRGATTRLQDLDQALDADQIAGCALDVYETEPLPEGHPLWAKPNAILTPHIAVKDAESVEHRRFDLFVNNANRFAAGEELRNIVDKANWF